MKYHMFLQLVHLVRLVRFRNGNLDIVVSVTVQRGDSVPSRMWDVLCHQREQQRADFVSSLVPFLLGALRDRD